jgi:hypothetical protein
MQGYIKCNFVSRKLLVVKCGMWFVFLSKIYHWFRPLAASSLLIRTPLKGVPRSMRSQHKHILVQNFLLLAQKKEVTNKNDLQGCKGVARGQESVATGTPMPRQDIRGGD